jgi:hypothetical protein
MQRSLIVKIESVIYEPPSPEFPHLVVTLTPNGVDVQTAADRTEARTIMRSIKQVEVNRPSRPFSGPPRW